MCMCCCRSSCLGACSRSSQGDCNTPCCVCIPYVCPQGIQDMLLQYLQLVMDFNTHDQAVLITVIGAGNFTVQVGASTGPALVGGMPMLCVTALLPGQSWWALLHTVRCATGCGLTLQTHLKQRCRWLGATSLGIDTHVAVCVLRAGLVVAVPHPDAG